MRRILVLLPLLAGCATGPSLQSRMAAFTGASEETLVRDLGVPDKQITTGGVQYLAYARHRAEIEPDDAFGLGGFGPFYPGGFYGGGFGGGGFFGGGFGGGLPQQVISYSCETTFMLRDGKVFGFTMRGNDCG